MSSYTLRKIFDVFKYYGSDKASFTKHDRICDTDIFPFPFEKYAFADAFDECLNLLVERDKKFDDQLAKHPPLTIEALTQIDYSGFRRATQIEPFWNVYYLALVLSIADEIENYRICQSKHTVFSYRCSWCGKTHSIFGDSTWNHYRDHTSRLGRDSKFAVLTDIADFYTRVNHHRLQNSLNRIVSGDTPSRVMKLLKHFSQTRSYGLPIGGPASRVLAELALADVDKHLEMSGVSFCRYADDYSIFCESEAEAYKNLVYLSEKLFNESLVLQKSKTKILSSTEFSDFYRLIDSTNGDSSHLTEENKLLSVSIRYDPYSDTSIEDYDTLKKVVMDINILGILNKEVAKTSIDKAVTKQAIKALRVLGVQQQKDALMVILDSNNLLTLAPVFVNVMRAVRGIYDDLDDASKDCIDVKLVDITKNADHLLKVELNLSYYIQALSRRQSVQKEQILSKYFDQASSHLLKRQIIPVMSEWNCYHWVSDQLKHFSSYAEWERRALIIGSYRLGDEGRHWRRNVKSMFNSTENLIKDWANSRNEQKRSIPI